MVTPTIERIRTLRDEIREKIKEADKKANQNQKYGGEAEYTYKGLIGGIDALLTDISTLTSSPNKFVRISSHAERNNIVSYLTHIQTYFNTPGNYIPQFELLKTLLRSLNVRNFSERQIEFEKEVVEVRKIKLELEQELKEVKGIKEAIDENKVNIDKYENEIGDRLKSIEEQLVEITENKDTLVEQSETLEETIEEVKSLKALAQENLEGIKESYNESKSNEKLIKSFSDKIYESEKQVELLEQKSKDNSLKLNEYEEERQNILKRAEDLIESAKKALNYKTAEGISASFQTQYDNSNNKGLFWGWIIGAIFFLSLSIGLGIWIALPEPSTSIALIIARISLLPLPIAGTIFCGNQYIKQKNIAEDYAYKTVLSKAIVGFSEELKKHGSENNEEYVHYIKTALKEIHKDPLRKRDKIKKDNKEKSNLNELVEVVEKVVKMSKSSE